MKKPRAEYTREGDRDQKDSRRKRGLALSWTLDHVSASLSGSDTEERRPYTHRRPNTRRDMTAPEAGAMEFAIHSRAGEAFV